MKNPLARKGIVSLLAVMLASVVVLSGCSAESEAGPTPSFSRAYGAPDPCQFTTLQLQPKEGVDLSVAGQKLVDGFEGYQAIGDVRLYSDESRLEVTWCNSMQSEQGVIRAVSLTNLVTIESVNTQPNAQQ